MYRAFAPFFMGVRGDRRVTGMAQRERGRLAGIKGVPPSVGARASRRHLGRTRRQRRLLSVAEGTSAASTPGWKRRHGVDPNGVAHCGSERRYLGLGDPLGVDTSSHANIPGVLRTPRLLRGDAFSVFR